MGPVDDENVIDKWGWSAGPGASEREIKLTEALALSRFILAVKSKPSDNPGNQTPSALYHEATNEELRQLGVSPSMLHDSGFDAGIFIGPDGQVIVAYPGTADAKDWGANVKGIKDISAQDRQAVELATILSRSVDSDKLIFTGLSLGGRLAALSSIASGAPAITINAAGISSNAQYMAAEAAGYSRQEAGAYLADNTTNVTAISIEGEPLTTAQDYMGVNNPAYGTRMWVNALENKSASHDPITMHGSVDYFQLAVIAELHDR